MRFLGKGWRNLVSFLVTHVLSFSANALSDTLLLIFSSDDEELLLDDESELDDVHDDDDEESSLVDFEEEHWESIISEMLVGLDLADCMTSNGGAEFCLFA